MGKFFLAAALVLLASGAQATTYTYTGVNFDAASSPYTTAMSVSGSITLASPLAPNLVGADLLASLESWSFSNGVQTYSSAAPPLFQQVLVSTDANGAIADWSVGFNISGSQEAVISCGSLGPAPALGTCLTSGSFLPGYDFGGAGFGGVSASAPIPGSWALVPEPSTALLLGLGLGLTGLAAKGRGRNRS